MEKLFIKNRKGENISVLVERSESQKGLAFVMHGSGGFKEQPQIQTIAKAFKESGYTVVRFDATCSIGESGGRYEDHTATNFYQDLEDVIKWASAKSWYEEPFFLAGHSTGALAVAWYTARHPKKVGGVAPISVPPSGKLLWTVYTPKELRDWRKKGWWERVSISKPGSVLRLKWQYMTDVLKYDLIKKAKRFTMPVLLMAGENDDFTPPKHQKIFYNALPDPKELHIIKDARHTFRDKKHLAEIKNLFLNWIDIFQK